MRFLVTSWLLQAATTGFDDSFLTIIARSGMVSKLTLIILLFFSIVSWAIIADRYFAYRRTRYQNGQFYRLFRKGTSLNELANTALRYRNSLFARMYLMVFNEINQYSRSEAGAGPVTVKASMNLTHDVVDRAITKAGLNEQTTLEKNLGFLATTASATPFIGLFGTVWGIINAFHAIGGARSTDLSVVAPGIAEALVATAMGLAAAIPAVIGYNYFTNQVRNFGTDLEEFSLEMMGFIERHQVISK